MDALFIGNSAKGEKAWAPRGNEPLPSEGSTGDEFYGDTQSDFMESFSTTIVSDSTKMVEELKEARKKKLNQLVEKTPSDRGAQ